MADLKELRNADCRVLVVGWLGFPFGSASSSRIRHFAKGLECCGVRTHVLTTRRIPLRECDINDDGLMVYDGVTYETTNVFETGERKTIIRRVINLLKATRSSWRRSKELLQAGRVNAVILNSRSFMQCQPIIRFCRKHGIPVVVDVVEWYLPWSIPYFMRTIDHYLGMHLSHRMCDGAIVISNFLDRQYGAWGLPTLLVPALIDSGKARDPVSKRDSAMKGVLNLVYVGQFKPDEAVDDLLNGVRLARERGCPVELHMIGNDGSTGAGRRVKKRVAASTYLTGHVHFRGWLTEEEYRQTLETADALALLRKATTRALAAFPTRLPEFLATGKPVITNDVPDIPSYLRDREHAHVVSAGRSDLVADRLEEIYRNPEKQTAIGTAGRRHMQECFDYREHGQRLGRFVRQLINRT